MFLYDLPLDILMLILSNLSPPEISRLSRTSSVFRMVLGNELYRQAVLADQHCDRWPRSLVSAAICGNLHAFKALIEKTNGCLLNKLFSPRLVQPFRRPEDQKKFKCYSRGYTNLLRILCILYRENHLSEEECTANEMLRIALERGVTEELYFVPRPWLAAWAILAREGKLGAMQLMWNLDDSINNDRVDEVTNWRLPEAMKHALAHAVDAQEMDVVRYCVEQGALDDCHKEEEEGIYGLARLRMGYFSTHLALAAHSADLEIFLFILKSFCSSGSYSPGQQMLAEALHHAVRARSVPIVETLLELGAEPLSGTLQLALSSDNLQLIRIVVDKCSDSILLDTDRASWVTYVRTCSALEILLERCPRIATFNAPPEVNHWVVGELYLGSCALKSEKQSMAMTLLRYGSADKPLDVDNPDPIPLEGTQRALRQILYENHTQVLDTIFSKHPYLIGTRTVVLRSGEQFGGYLVAAALREHTDLKLNLLQALRCLIGHGADVSFENVLIDVCRRRDIRAAEEVTPVVRYLLDRGIDLSKRDKRDITLWGRLLLWAPRDVLFAIPLPDRRVFSFKESAGLLGYIVRRGYYEAARFLIEGNPSLIHTHLEPFGRTLLQSAVSWAEKTCGNVPNFTQLLRGVLLLPSGDVTLQDGRLMLDLDDQSAKDYLDLVRYLRCKQAEAGMDDGKSALAIVFPGEEGLARAYGLFDTFNADTRCGWKSVWAEAVCDEDPLCHVRCLYDGEGCA